MVREYNYLGIDFTYLGKIETYMKTNLKHFPNYIKLLNTRNLKNIYREYLALIAQGCKKCDIVSGTGNFLKWDTQTYKMSNIIADKTNLPKLFILNFFIALYNLAKTGKIDFKIWNPKEYTQSVNQLQTLETQQNFLNKLNISTKLLPIVLIGGLIGGFLLTSKVKKY